MSAPFVQRGKKKREELTLPMLHFVVVDDWIPKLSEKTFAYWLKLHSLVDRTDEAENKYGNKLTIPRSFEDLYENVFGMSKPTFYRTVIHPLWNYGLIDIVEWEASKKLGQKPMNIIVYDYPQNRFELAVQPLEKCRDYKKDYHSKAAVFGRIGGEMSREKSLLKREENDGYKNITVDTINDNKENTDLNNRYKNVTVDGYKNETVTVKNLKPINYTNTIVNYTNTLINEEEDKKILNKDSSINIHSSVSHYLKKELNYSDYEVQLILEQMIHKGIESFTKEQLLTQHKRMLRWVSQNKEEVRDMGVFFVEGILRHERSRQRLLEDKKIRKEQKALKQPKLENVPFYNWLE